MVLVETQVTKGNLPAIYRPAALRAVLLLFLASFLPTPWLAVSMPRTSTLQISHSLLEFAIGITLGAAALPLAWRLFLRAFPGAVKRGSGGSTLHAAYVTLFAPLIIIATIWLPMIRWSLLGGYFLAAGGGFFALLLVWVQRLPDSAQPR